VNVYGNKIDGPSSDPGERILTCVLGLESESEGKSETN
jgi:hypothetical protein